MKLRELTESFLSAADQATAGDWLADLKEDLPCPKWVTPDITSATGGLLLRFTHYYPMNADSLFIVAARNLAPEIIRRQSKIIEEMRGALEKLVMPDGSTCSYDTMIISEFARKNLERVAEIERGNE